MVRQFATEKYCDYSVGSVTSTITAEDMDYDEGLQEAAIIMQHNNADQSSKEIADSSGESDIEAANDANVQPSGPPVAGAGSTESQTRESHPSDEPEVDQQSAQAVNKQTVSTEEESSDDEDTCILLATTEGSAREADEGADSPADCGEDEMELVEEEQEAGEAEQDNSDSNLAPSDAKLDQIDRQDAAEATQEELKKQKEEDKQQRKLAKRERKRVKRIAKKVAKKAEKNEALFPKRPNPEDYLINARLDNHPNF